MATKITFNQLIEEMGQYPEELLFNYLTALSQYKNNFELEKFKESKFTWSHWINFSFNWVETPQGSEYWSEICKLKG